MNTVDVLREATVMRRAEILRDVRRVVLTDLGAEWEIEEVARRAATSRRQVQRAFADAGVTWRDWLCHVRMQHAARLLAEPGSSVRKVAGRVGYRQPSQFAKAFRRVHGVSPSAFAMSRRPTPQDIAA